MTEQMMLVKDAVEKSMGLGYDRVEHIAGSTYRDCSTVVVVPSRGTMSTRVFQAHESLIAPMNQKRAKFYATGHEVGQAYDAMIENILAHPQLKDYKYILTLEDDNLPQPDAHIRLLESIAWGDFDAVSGIYFTKGDFNMPMAYGDPDHYSRTGELEFKPRDVRAALQQGTLMPVNGIAMGCALWKLDLYKQMPKPWYETVADWSPEKGGACGTQDLVFCAKARRAGKRFAVDLRVRVAHLDVNTGVCY